MDNCRRIIQQFGFGFVMMLALCAVLSCIVESADTTKAPAVTVTAAVTKHSAAAEAAAAAKKAAAAATKAAAAAAAAAAKADAQAKATSSAATTAAATTAAATTAAATAAAKAAATTSAAAGSSPDLGRPRRMCVFPFWHRSQWHHTCIKYSAKGHFWCSVTRNFTLDENWKECEAHDLHRFHCHIPFKYKGKDHSSCLPLSELGGGGFWCGVSREVKRVTWTGIDWALCENVNATGADYLHAVGPHRNLTEARAAADAAAAAAAAAAGSGNSSIVSAEASAAASAGSGSTGGTGAASGGSEAASDDGRGSSAASQAAMTVVVCTVCAAAVVGVVMAGYVMRRRNQYKRIDDPLLNSEPIDKSGSSAYGGVQEYHD